MHYFGDITIMRKITLFKRQMLAIWLPIEILIWMQYRLKFVFSCIGICRKCIESDVNTFDGNKIKVKVSTASHNHFLTTHNCVRVCAFVCKCPLSNKHMNKDDSRHDSRHLVHGLCRASVHYFSKQTSLLFCLSLLSHSQNKIMHANTFNVP